MQITTSAQLKRPFSLYCTNCDAGMEHATPEQALSHGWSDIEEDFGGGSWNYLGTCPDCRESDEQLSSP